MARRGNLIPVFTDVLADTETPVSAYLKVQDKSPSYLLESAPGDGRWGRYSFIGFKPHSAVISLGSEVRVLHGEEIKTIEGTKNPLQVLRKVMGDFRLVAAEDLPPLQGGFVGYCNYDLVRTWEDHVDTPPETSETPELHFIFARRMIVFDHLTHRMKVLAFAVVREGADLKALYQEACREVDETLHDLNHPLPPKENQVPLELPGMRSNFTKEGFQEAVRKAKNHIVAGDVIQVVLSQRFSGEVAGDDFLLYRSLRSVNPSPYMFYLRFGETILIGSSPEVLVRLRDRKVELRPIAGTRRRGKNHEEDQSLVAELLADPKERAEHIMLVDLGRNDVGKVAVPGSVHVPQLMEVERYSHVMHIVSQVEGELKSACDAFDLFMAGFPAGTVTGAPKVRAMQIIRDVEPSSRGPYAGAVGYFGFNGHMDFCITIRTVTIAKGRLSVQVGAGIVADSSPEKEYDETLRKAAAMFEAIDRARTLPWRPWDRPNGKSCLMKVPSS